MHEQINDIEFNINKIEEKENGYLYKISIKIPESHGYIESVNFYAEADRYTNINQLQYVESKDGYAYFTRDVFLDTKALYHFYFSYEANGDLKPTEVTSGSSKKVYWKCCGSKHGACPL